MHGIARESLRSMDPTFGNRRLTLVDGIVLPSVEVWLLRADDTQIEPAAPKCDPGPSDPPQSDHLHELSYSYPVEQVLPAD